MNNIEIRKSIAVVLGWEPVISNEMSQHHVGSYRPQAVEIWRKPGCDDSPYPPEITLESLHDAELLLTPGQRRDYCHWIQVVTCCHNGSSIKLPEWRTDGDNLWAAITASESQRAEALLRTLNKWRDLLSAEEARQMFEYVPSIVTTKTARSKCSICNREFSARELSQKKDGEICIECLVRALNESLKDSAEQSDQKLNAIQEMDRTHIENKKLRAQLEYMQKQCVELKAKLSREVALSGTAAIELGKNAVYDERYNEYATLQPNAGDYIRRDQVKPLLEALEGYAQCSDGCTCGDGWSHDPAVQALNNFKSQSNEQRAKSAC